MVCAYCGKCGVESMPAKIDNCVQSCLDNPDFKSKDPDQTKEEACWALCTWLDGQGKLSNSKVPNFMDLADEALASLEKTSGDSWQQAIDLEIESWAEVVGPETARTVNSLGDFALASPGASWSFSGANGDAILKRGGWSLFNRVHFYRNPGADRETKAAYKLPYAKIQGESVKIFRSALLAVQAVLLGGRGGVDIPGAEKKRVAKQVIKGLRRFDTEPSEGLRELAKSGRCEQEFDLDGYLEFYRLRGIEIISEWIAEAGAERQGWPYCVCPECGYTEDKQAGVACRTIKCPECGVSLMGSQSKGKVTESVMKRSDNVQTPHAFRVVLPVTRAEKRISRTAGEDLTEHWLHIEASGPERDSHGTRMSPACLARFVAYAEAGIDGEPLPYLDGHYQDLLAAMLGDVRNPGLTEDKHFAVDVLLDGDNPHSMRLYRDVERGKRHGASIAGIVHDFSIEKYQDEDGKEVFEEVFDDIELVEISRTTWPSWRSSFTEMIGKHMHPADAGELTELRARRSMIADARPTLARMLEAHDVDENFEVSDGPWAEVADLTHRHQYAIVRRHSDGAFSPGQSGYVHHTPNGSVSREGLCLAVDALSADLASDELPFRMVEMEHAALHLARHVVNELGEPVPEGLQAFARLDDITEVAMAIQTDSAPDEMLSQESVQTEPTADETEVVERVVEETEEIAEPETVELEVTEPEVLDTEPVITASDVAKPVVVTPDIDFPGDTTARAAVANGTVEDETVETAEEVELEPESEIEPEPESTQMSELKMRLSDGLAVTAMSRLLFATQGLLAERIWQEGVSAEERVALGSQILDEFLSMAKDMLPALATASKEPDLLCEFIGRVELVEGVLSRRRANKVVELAARCASAMTQLSQVLNNMDLLDDTGDVQGVSELRSEVRDSLSEIRGRLQDAVEDTQQTEHQKVAEIIARLEQRANQPAQSRRVAAPPPDPKAQTEMETEDAKRRFIASLAS